MAVITKTVKPSGGDYTSLTAWDAAEATDLVTATNSHVVECYKGDYGAGGGVNYITENVYIQSPWVTSATYNLTIKTPDSERHTGKPKSSGVYTGFTLYAVATYDSCLNLHVGNVIVDGLMIDIHLVHTYTKGVYADYVSGIVFKNMIIMNGRSPAYVIAEGTCINCIAIDCVAEYGSTGEGFSSGMWRNNKFYNCGAQNCAVGFRVYDGGNASTFKNCWAKGCTTDWSASGGAPYATVEYCASGDATVPSGTGNRASQTFTFVDEANDLFQPSSSDAAIKGYGVDLSSIFTKDIIGNTRATPWDIGPFIAAAPLSTVKFRRTFSQLGAGMGKRQIMGV